MFRPMRRAAQELSREETEAILARGTAGVLALQGDDGYPYAVPMSYLYADGCLWFHCGTEGHRMDSIARSEKASFCVIDRDEVIPQENTTYYRSVIAFGRIERVTEADDRLRGHLLFTRRYNPGYDSVRGEQPGNVVMLRMRIEHMTGKEAKKLSDMRREANGQ